MNHGIATEIRLSQAEQGDGRLAPLFLEMNERAGQLDQAFVKQIVCLAALGQPQFFQDFVGFEKKVTVKAFEIAQVMGVKSLVLYGADQLGNFLAFMAHHANDKQKGALAKGRIARLAAPTTPQPKRRRTGALQNLR